MKRWLVGVTLLFLAFASLEAGGFSKMATGRPELIQSGPQKMWCPVCGMNLKMFYKTSHGVVLKDGTKRQYCSIRCLAADWKHIADKVKKILVVDAAGEKLIDARKAYYVVGSKVHGTMSRVSKIAFASRRDAEAFKARYGGRIVGFDEAFKMAADALGGDTAMIAKKKKKKIYPMGKKIYAKMCQKIDVSGYGHINELKAAIKRDGLCKPMKEKQLQAVALYLWDVVGGHADDRVGCGCGMKSGDADSRRGCRRGGSKGSGSGCDMHGGEGCGHDKGCRMERGKKRGCGCSRQKASPALVAAPVVTQSQELTVKKSEKCPVCGMFVYKYPKWAAFIYYRKGDSRARLAFDGVKDLMKFYLDPAKWGYDPSVKKRIVRIVVQDYYTLRPVAAREAFYVIGSDVFGPMGNELIPFADKKAAENFLKDHRGKKILRFDEITPDTVAELDE